MWSLTVGILRRLPKQLNTPGFFNSELTGDFFFSFTIHSGNTSDSEYSHASDIVIDNDLSFGSIMQCSCVYWAYIRLSFGFFLDRPWEMCGLINSFLLFFFKADVFSCAWWLQCQYGNIQFKHSVKMICRSNVQSFKCSYLLLNKWNMCTIYPALNWWMAKGERNNTFDGGIYLTVRAVN